MLIHSDQVRIVQINLGLSPNFGPSNSLSFSLSLKLRLSLNEKIDFTLWLNFGLSLNFRLSERLIQKVKSPNVSISWMSSTQTFMLQLFDIFCLSRRFPLSPWNLPLLKIFSSIAIYPLLWNLTTQCLTVTGSDRVGECGRINRHSWLLSVYSITNLLTYLLKVSGFDVLPLTAVPITANVNVQGEKHDSWVKTTLMDLIESELIAT